MIRHIRPLLLALCLLMPAIASLAGQAGTLIATEGTVFVTSGDAARKRIVAPGSSLSQGDTLQTEKESTAKISFLDGSVMVVRPSTTVVLKDYQFDELAPSKDSFVVDLVRGGLRQITGLIGKRGNQDAYRLQGSSSTIGIRGTDFSARVCGGRDCDENGVPSRAAPVQPARQVVAKVVEHRGKVTAYQANGQRRDLTVEGAVYQDDIVSSEFGGHASLLFTDETRVVVPGDSSFKVAAYRFNPEQPEKGKVSLGLVRGALRMVTGIVGKRVPSNVAVEAGTSTIGIRGTVFDLACVPAGLTSPEAYGGSGQICGGGSGLLTSTRDGVISVTTSDGQTSVFAAGQSSYVGGPNQAPVLLKFSPEFLKLLPGPLPEKIQIDIPGTFGIDGSSLNDIGLYVSVSEGRVVVFQGTQQMLLGAGESGFASGTTSKLQRLSTPPAILSQDKQQTQQIETNFHSCRL